MGPGIAAEPHCAELEIAGLRFVPILHPEGKASAFHDPCALAQASRRSRSAAWSPRLFPVASASFRPCGRSSLSPRLCRRFPDPKAPVRRPLLVHRFAPAVLVLACASNSLRSEEGCNLPSFGSVLNPPPELVPGKPAPSRSATYRPFAALLGIIVFRAALTSLAESPACGGETIISSGASCRLCFEDPPAAPFGHPGEAQSLQTEFHFVALPAEIG